MGPRGALFQLGGPIKRQLISVQQGSSSWACISPVFYAGLLGLIMLALIANVGACAARRAFLSAMPAKTARFLSLTAGT